MSRPGLEIDVLGELKHPEDTPDVVLPVVAVAGRSNVGKSSLLNALLGRHHLLRTSRTPGCTRTIQLVSIVSSQASFVLADLPGYGYAALSRERRESWGPLIEGFLTRTRRLAVVLMLIDVRRGPEKEEQNLLDFLDRQHLEPIVVLTKCDKLQRSKAKTAVERMRSRVRGVETHATTASTGEGLDGLWRAIVRRVSQTATSSATPKKKTSTARTTTAAVSGMTAAGTPSATSTTTTTDRPKEGEMADPQQEKFQRARSAATAGRLDEAIALCHELLEAEPQHRGAMDMLGFAHFFKKEYAVAEQWCRKTLALYPQHAYGHKGLGLCLARQGKLEEGLPHLRQAMTLDPLFFDPYWDTAVVLREAGRHQEALEVLERGVAACPARAPRVKAMLEELRRKLAVA